MDALLGFAPGGAVAPAAAIAQKAPPAIGKDARSLQDPEVVPIVITPQKATYIAVAFFVLLVLAFVSGFLIGSRV